MLVGISAAMLVCASGCTLLGGAIGGSSAPPEQPFGWRLAACDSGETLVLLMKSGDTLTARLVARTERPLHEVPPFPARVPSADPFENTLDCGDAVSMEDTAGVLHSGRFITTTWSGVWLEDEMTGEPVLLPFALVSRILHVNGTEMRAQHPLANARFGLQPTLGTGIGSDLMGLVLAVDDGTRSLPLSQVADLLRPRMTTGRDIGLGIGLLIDVALVLLLYHMFTFEPSHGA